MRGQKNGYGTEPPSHSCPASGTNVIPSSRIATSQTWNLCAADPIVKNLQFETLCVHLLEDKGSPVTWLARDQLSRAGERFAILGPAADLERWADNRGRARGLGYSRAECG